MKGTLADWLTDLRSRLAIAPDKGKAHRICTVGTTGLRALIDDYDALFAEHEELKRAKDTAYAERNALVAALSKIWPAHLALHPDDPTWERDWMHIVCIHAPCGQLTWHIHDSEVPAFAHLEMKPGDWDGHTTALKYARLATLKRVGDWP